MAWQKMKIPATDAARANGLQNDFEAIFTALQAPSSAALFGNLDTDDDFTFYFSPEAARIFSARLPGLGAEKCAPPPKAKAKLLIGDNAINDMLA